MQGALMHSCSCLCIDAQGSKARTAYFSDAQPTCCHCHVDVEAYKWSGSVASP